MKHHTQDISKKAESIADKAAEQNWREFHSYTRWLAEWLHVYNQTLLEFQERKYENKLGI